MMRKRSAFLSIVLLFAAMSLSPLAAPTVVAQEAAVTIEYGDTVSGTITDDTPSISYRFEGEMNDVVTIAMQADICGNLNPRLVLLNAAGVRVAEDDDGGPGVDALIYAFTLPQYGVYTIMAGRSGNVDGTTLGDFTLSLDRADFTEIAFGESARGSISPNGLADLFQVDLTVGDLVRIGATSETLGIDPEITVLDPAGTPIVTNNDSGGRNMPLVDPLIVPVTGTYTVAVYTTNEVGGSVEVFAEETRAVEVTRDEIVSGELSEDNRSGVYLYSGLAGELIAIRVRRTVESFEPYISVYQGVPSEATRIAWARGSRMAAVSLGLSLPADGLYVIIVDRHSSPFGNYEMVVQSTTLGDF